MSVAASAASRRYEGAIAFDIVEAGAERAVATMQVTPAMLNPFGTVHAGAMIWFADVTATICAIGDTTIGPKGEGFPLAVDLHTVLAANERDGVLTATATPVRRGRSLIVIRTDVTGESGRLLISMTTTHVPAR